MAAVIAPTNRLGMTLGLHVNEQKQISLYDTITSFPAWSSYCTQCYLSHDPWTMEQPTQADLDQCRNFMVPYERTLMLHCADNANLATPGAQLRGATMRLLRNHLKIANQIPCTCVLHLGTKNNKAGEGTLDRVAEGLNQLVREGHLRESIFPHIRHQLVVENSAGQGACLGRSFDELRSLFEKLDTRKVGLLIDTQHAFAAGLTTWTDHNEVVKFFEEVETITPYGPSGLHLNDSKPAFGSNVDRHEDIGQGQIFWSGGIKHEGLQTILAYARERGLDCILETPDAVQDYQKLIE